MTSEKPKKPRITVSSLDAQRLRDLLDQIDDGSLIGVDELLAELDRADIVEPENVPADVVTMNSRVHFREVNSDRSFSLTLVYPSRGGAEEKAQGDYSSLSILAPVGSALLGLREGDTIEWPRPGGGVLTLEIIEVLYQPEREGELHR